ncbi:MAG TPA: sulfatase [Planctomycetaceae bacterium]|nr:sulfatase [Planctomycetaceae bacterium]
MDRTIEQQLPVGRRGFLSSGAGVPGLAAVGELLRGRALADQSAPPQPPRAKRLISLFQSGAPSQLDLFDYKPGLSQWAGSELPESVRQGQRLTGMTSTQASFPIAPSMFRFRQRGSSGAWVSDLLPRTAGIADRLCFIRSMHTEAINHDPAITFVQTGAQLAGRPSLGAWLSYGLGSENQDLPAYVAMISGTGDQPLYDRLWGSGFLPTRYSGVKFRSQGDPVLYLSNPAGITTDVRRGLLDDLQQLNGVHLQQTGDPEIATRIAQYEMAFRMQTSVPELTDLSNETAATFEMYGEDSRKPGSFAWNCLMARRLCERGVRFVQLFHRGWDQHLELPKNIAMQCRMTDQPAAALVVDLEQRGLLDDTVVTWGGEFGRTVYCQGKLTPADYGRDHHPRCFSMWLAGGGVQPGLTWGETDDFSYNIVRDPVHVHDLNATLLHLLGIDHVRLTWKFQGRHYRLTDVHGNVVRELLS